MNGWVFKSAMVATLALGLSLGACASKERGPFENTGHEIDKGLDKTGKAAEDAGKTVEKGAKDTGNTVSDWWHRNF